MDWIDWDDPPDPSDERRCNGIDDAKGRRVVVADSGVYPPRGPVAEHIAASNPTAVLELIAEVRRLDAIVGDRAHRALNRAIDDDVEKFKLRAALKEACEIYDRDVPGVQDTRIWEKIVAYCQIQENPSGKFRTADLTEALLPDKFKEDPAVALSTIYTAVKRRSLGVSNDPYFVWLKKGRFRLATTEERAKAREGAK